MTAIECRHILGLSQRELAEELSSVFPKIDKYIVSKVECGICRYPEDVEEYLKGVATAKIASQTNENSGVDKLIVEDDLSRISGDTEELIYSMLADLEPGERLTRSDLVGRIHEKDRQIRRAIESLRAKGIRVCSGGGAPGYYLAKSDEEYRAFEREYLSRAYTAIQNAWAMKRNNTGQLKYEQVHKYNE